MAPLRWGIIAPGSIAHKFAEALDALPEAELVAVGSRSLDRAKEFAAKYGAGRAYGSYEDLVSDDEVDAVYVANPHNYHRDSVVLCLEHGKAVLCEKPLAVSAREVQVMIDAARRNRVFLMEAMWTRFLPVWQKVRSWIDEGAIGDVRIVNGTFGFRSAWNPEGRLLNPHLAGGGLLDVGIYLTAMAYWVTRREPVDVVSATHLGETGVDEQAAFVLKYEDGALASLTCSVRTTTRHVALIYGTEGWIEVPHMFWNTTEATLHRDGEEDVVFSEPFIRNGFEYEVREAGECIATGRLESPILPLDESLQIVRTLDAVRAQAGLVYPFEREDA